MSTPTDAPTTVSNIGVVMFTVADQDAAIAFYRDRLGWEVRGDTTFGENGEHRWVEVAPPGSSPGSPSTRRCTRSRAGARSGSRPPTSSASTGGCPRSRASTGPEPMRSPGTPLMFMLRDPDKNVVMVVEVPAAG